MLWWKIVVVTGVQCNVNDLMPIEIYRNEFVPSKSFKWNKSISLERNVSKVQRPGTGTFRIEAEKKFRLIPKAKFSGHVNDYQERNSYQVQGRSAFRQQMVPYSKRVRFYSLRVMNWNCSTIRSIATVTKGRTAKISPGKFSKNHSPCWTVLDLSWTHDSNSKIVNWIRFTLCMCWAWTTRLQRDRLDKTSKKFECCDLRFTTPWQHAWKDWKWQRKSKKNCEQNGENSRFALGRSFDRDE